MRAHARGGTSPASMWTGTRVPRNTGFPLMILPSTDPWSALGSSGLARPGRRRCARFQKQSEKIKRCGKPFKGSRVQRVRGASRRPAAALPLYAHLPAASPRHRPSCEQCGDRRAQPTGRAKSATMATGPDEATRTSNSACVWIAEATVEGRTYTARSRYGPANQKGPVDTATRET